MKTNLTSFPGVALILLTSWLFYNEENTKTNDKNVDYLCVSPIRVLLFLGSTMWLTVVHLRWLMQMGRQLPQGQGCLLLFLMWSKQLRGRNETITSLVLCLFLDHLCTVRPSLAPFAPPYGDRCLAGISPKATDGQAFLHYFHDSI